MLQSMVVCVKLNVYKCQVALESSVPETTGSVPGSITVLWV